MDVDGRTTAIKLLGGKVRFTGQNGQSDNSEAKFKEVPISSETNEDIHTLHSIYFISTHFIRNQAEIFRKLLQ